MPAINVIMRIPPNRILLVQVRVCNTSDTNNEQAVKVTCLLQGSAASGTILKPKTGCFSSKYYQNTLFTRFYNLSFISLRSDFSLRDKK